MAVQIELRFADGLTETIGTNAASTVNCTAPSFVSRSSRIVSKSLGARFSNARSRPRAILVVLVVATRESLPSDPSLFVAKRVLLSTREVCGLRHSTTDDELLH